MLFEQLLNNSVTLINQRILRLPAEILCVSAVEATSGETHINIFI